MTKKEQKNELRQKLLELRSSMQEEEYLKKSARICSHLITLTAYQQANTIHCYVSMNERCEVNTHPLIKAMLNAGKKVVVPLTEFESGTLQHIYLREFDQLRENKWGVLEPVDGEEVSVHMLDLVIVPMVGGDRKKNRLGYGKGFYDRFLANVDCPTIGLLFDEYLIKEIPTEPFDIALSKLITEDGFLE